MKHTRTSARRQRFAPLVLLAAPILSLPGQRAADTLVASLADVRRLAIRANPELSIVRMDTAIAHGELRQAGLLRFNPSGDLLGASGGNGVEAGVTQEIELFGQRGARITAGRAGLDRSRLRVLDATRLLIGDVDRNFYRLAAAVRRANLAADILALNERLADVASRQLGAGEISRLDYNLAIVELGRSRSRLIAERRQVQQVRIQLARQIGAANVTLLPLLDSTQHPPLVDTSRVRPHDLAFESPDSLDIAPLVARAMRQRPDLAERRAAIDEASALARVARREGLPNLLVRGAAEPRAAGTGRAWRPGVGLTVPLFNRNQGEAAAREAAARQVELDRVALLTRLRADVQSAAAVYRSAATEVEVLESTVLVPARQNRQLLETAYREGEVGLPVLLLIRNQVIDAELGYWSAWLSEREARAALDEATGDNLRDLPNAMGDIR